MAAPRRTRPAPVAVAAAARRPAPAVPAWLIGAALLAATLIAYVQALQGGFVWDDDDYVTANTTLRSLDGLRRIWLEPGAVPQYYPLTFTSLWLQYQLSGAAPFAYHLVNVLLHGLSAVLLWRLLLMLQVPGAALAAALFALHPVHVESVAWITERKNVLSGACYLAAALAWLRFASARVGRWRWYAAALALFAGALLSKTVTASLPAALLLIAWWKRGRIASADVVPLLPLFALGAGLSAVTVWMEKHHVGAAGADWHLSFIDRCLIAGRALWFYAATLAWPQRLTFMYPRWQIDSGVWWQYLFPLAAFGAVATLFLARQRLGRGPLIAVLFFAGSLLPALGFIDVFPMRYSFVADHYQYLASIGLLALAAAVWSRAGAPLGRGRAVIAGVVLAVCALLTWQQGHAYRDLETLWRDTLAKNPGAWMAHNNFGLLLYQRGDTAAAMEHYAAALRAKPDDSFAHNNLGNAFATQGRMNEAVTHFRAAIEIDPLNAEARSNLGNALASLGQLDEAAAAYAAALQVRPDYADAHGNLANVLAAQGRIADAMAHYTAALAIDPDFVDAHRNFGVVLSEQGDLAGAIAHYRAALRGAAKNADLHVYLARALAQQGQRDAAAQTYREALRLRPDWPEVQAEAAALHAAPP